MTGALIGLALLGLILGIFVGKVAGQFDGYFAWFPATVAFVTWGLLWWALLAIVGVQS
jgi:hypothetical protein